MKHSGGAAQRMRAAHASPPHRYSDWDLYRFGLWTGLRSFPDHPVEGLKRLINPIEYIRCAEFRYVLEHLQMDGAEVVLDIGSPKLLSLFLAARYETEVHATDLMDYFFGSYGVYADRVLGAHRGRYRIEIQDARSLGYPDGSVDRVFSVSALEHIPGVGDSMAMREIARVLRPGGLCCLTMPWSDRGYLEEYRDGSDPDAYWAGGGDSPVFYQRAYDRATLESRILEPSGLELVDLDFWGERRIAVEDMMTALPSRPLRWAVLPAHFYLNRLFLSRLRADEPSRKKVVCLTLRKPPD